MENFKKSSNDDFKKAQDFAREVIIDLNQSVTSFHAVETLKNKLIVNGFTELKEK